jgi:hypothetical protein
MGSMARWLSCHVAYACRHSGACCGAGWPVPIERAVVPAIDKAVAAGRIRPADESVAWVSPHAAAPPEMAGTLRLLEDRCVFHQPRADGARACAVHSVLGHDHLPTACQHFPRVCLIDDRGVHVSLSHFCPTAAAMLLDSADPVTIVDGAPPVAGRDVPEGLDVRGALPPLVGPRVLADLEGYTAWERHVVETLAGHRPRGASAAEAVSRLWGDAQALGDWRPGETSLAAAVAALPGRSPRTGPHLPDPRDLFERVRASCQPPWAWAPPPEDLDELDARFVAPIWPAMDLVVRRFLAAHAFACWEAYGPGGLRALAGAVARALAVLRIEAARLAGEAGVALNREILTATVRRADLLLRHHADPASGA